MRQMVVTPAMGKRLIAKALVRQADVGAAMKKGILAIIAGSTNGYVAQEVLGAIGQAEGFSPRGFRRGVVLPPAMDQAAVKADFPGDVIIVNGQWQRGKEIFDVVDDMQAGDVILKGANALDLCRRQAALLIAHPMGGTIGAAIPAVIGRRVKMIVPVGLEKRVSGDLAEMAALLNAPGAQGPRMAMLPGEVFTELDAITLLTGASARLVAAGGVHGAEGAVWLVIDGDPAHVSLAEELVRSVAGEGPCQA